MDCQTPSNPHGLSRGMYILILNFIRRIPFFVKGYNIDEGESLDIFKAIEKAGGSDLSQWEWHK